MIRLGVLFGGKSGEHEVSCISAASVIKAADKEKFIIVPIGITKEGKWLLYEGPVDKIADGSWQQKAEEDLAKDPERFSVPILGTGGRSLADIIDFALPIMHGPNGEDGTVQGLLELINIPYGASGVVGSSAAMDKLIARSVFTAVGLPQCDYVGLDILDMEQGKELTLPGKWEDGKTPCWFVKPCNMGSSVGISRVTDEASMKEALKEAFRYDRRVIIEEGIQEPREIEVAVFGNEDPVCGSIGEILPSEVFYTYHAKYLDNGGSKLCIPADLSPETAEKVKEMAKKAYKALDCAGFARVDFLMCGKTGELYINEINTIPGFTAYSMFPQLWENAGLPYAKQIEKMVELGYERYNVKNHR